MKRVSAIILSVLLLITTLFTVPFAAVAEDPARYYTKVDFTGEADFFGGTSRIYNAELSTDPDTSSGKGDVMKVTCIGGNNTATNIKDGGKFNIPNSDSSDFFWTEANTTYTITFDMKVTKAEQPGEVRLMYMTSAGWVAWTHYDGPKITDISVASNGSWQSYSYTFTADAVYKLGITVTNSSWGAKKTGQEIYFDNVTIGIENTVTYANVTNTEELPSKILSSDRYEDVLVDPVISGFDGWYLDDAFTKPATGFVNAKGGVTLYAKSGVATHGVNYTHVDFTEEKPYYTEKAPYYNASITADPDAASDHGDVMQVNVIGGAAGTNRQKDGGKFAITNDGGTDYFWTEVGKKYIISFDMKLTKADVGFELHLSYLNSYNGVGWNFIEGKKLANVSAASNGEWVRYTYEFTATGTHKLVLVATNANIGNDMKRNQQIYFDNIVVTRVNSISYGNVSETTDLPTSIAANEKYEHILEVPEVFAFAGWYLDDAFKKPALGVADTNEDITLYAKVAPNTKVDFTEEKPYYTEKAPYYNASITADPDTASDHGDVMQVNVIGGAAGTNRQKDGGKFAITNDGGTDYFWTEVGKKYIISFDMKLTKADVGFELHLSYLNSHNGVGWNFIEGKKLANVSASSNGEWVRYTYEFTATGTHKLVLVATNANIGNDMKRNQQIYFDNITIQQAVTTDVTLNKNNGEDRQTVTMGVTDKVSSIVIPTRTGYDFAGWYYDENLTKPAHEKVGVITELWAKWTVAAESSIIDFEETVYTADNSYFIYNAERIADHNATGDSAAMFDQVRDKGQGWQNGIILADDAGSGAFKLESGITYKISYDMKAVKADNAFGIYILVSERTGNMAIQGSFGTVVPFTKVYSHSAASGEAAYTRYSATFVAPAAGTAIFSLISDGYESKDGQQVYIDNISIEKVVTHSLTLHLNNGQEDMVINATQVTEISSLESPVKEGFAFGGWYTDSVLSNPASGQVGAITELWAKWNFVPASSHIDFDEPAYKNDTSYFVYYVNRAADHNAEGDSAAVFTEVRHKGQGWQNGIILANDAGTGQYKLDSGATYEISYEVKTVNAANAFSIYMLATNATGNMAIEGSLGNIVPFRKLSSHSAATGESEYTKYSFTFVSPASGNAILSLISDGYNTYKEQQIYVDNITINKLKSHEITLHKNNGQQDATAIVSLKEKDFAIPAPVNAGYVFEGWYLDADLTTPFTFGEIDEDSFNVTELWAKWIAEEDAAYSFETGFEDADYAYTNNGTAADVNSNLTDRNVYVSTEDGGASTGNGFLVLNNPNGNYVADADRWLSAALVDKDGNSFQVVKGTRYRLTYYVKFTGSSSGTVYYNFLTSNNVPTGGVNKTNSTVIPVLYNYSGGSVHSAFDYWYEDEVYFIAEKTGKVFVTAYSTALEQQVCFDDIKIEIADPDKTSLIQYYNEDGSKLLHSTFGEAGEIIYGLPATLSETGKRFDGWRTADGKQWISSKYPENDLKLYASWRAADTVGEDPVTEFGEDSTVTVDFENAGEALAYYQDYNYIYGGPAQGMFIIPDDPDNAHSGSSYFRFWRASHWMKQYYRKMRIMDMNSPDGKIWLEPNTVYKISYWYNPDSVGASNLYLANFADGYTDGYEVLAENYLNDAAIYSQFGKWNYYEATVYTGSYKGSLGFVLYGGYFTVSIDDISVTKCSMVDITFETNGGNEINSLNGNSHHTFIGPDDPVREGYIFAGWYTDAAFKNPFNFTTDLVIEDIVLYAKWEPKKYRTVVTYEEKDVEVDVVPEDAHLDEALKINHSKDKIGTISDNISEQTASLAWLWILLACIGGVILVAGVILLIILLAKKRKKKEA